MTKTMDFTTSEWQTLQFAPLWAFSLVAGVDGKIEFKEFKAFAEEIGDASSYKSPLVRNVLSSIGSDFAATAEAYFADTRKIDVGLTEVADLLSTKVDHDEAVMFKAAIVMLAVKVAKAGRGRFHRSVGKNEKAAVVFLGSLLHFDPAEFNQIGPNYVRH